MKYRKIDEIRFWSSVNVTKKNNGCWYWKKNTGHSFGYGSFRINGKTYLSHRLALIFFCGNENKDKFVLHSCDNPACCNPNHLRWGTQKENISDSIKRGRKTDPPRNGSLPPVFYGEDCPTSVMTEKKVKELRKLYSEGWSVYDLAKRFNISKSTVYQIKNFKTWKGVS